MATKVELTIEKDQEGTLFGRVTYDENLIVDEAEDLQTLEVKFRKLLADFHQVTDVEFTYAYDLSTFFDTFDFLKISKVAEIAGMNPSLVRHYANGTKTASADQVKRLENAVRVMVEKLSGVSLIAA